MRSMTGYGRCRMEIEGREMTVEVKSVNHRFLDIAFRMPRSLAFLEEPIRKELSARLSRGHVDVFIAYRNARADARVVHVDLALLGAYQTALSQMSQAVHATDPLRLSDYARLPDVLTVSEQDEDQEAVTALMRAALARALDGLVAMREREGESLAQDMRGKLACLAQLREQIAQRAPLVTADYRERLRARIEQLADVQLDEQRLTQEVALFADRAAIDEELVRLQSHIAQLLSLTEQDAPVGRKLDFLVQELNREVNTIGSKGSDLTIAGFVVEAKSEIEKLREQVQNIE